MEKTYYVLQCLVYSNGKKQWLTMAGEYETAEEAEGVRLLLPIPDNYRVAEAYTVTRYKAVKVQ